MIVGTPVYIPHETFQGIQASEQSDIYSYGATIYHLATNSPPFVGKNHHDLFDKHFSENPIPIESARPDLSPRWSEIIINQCLAKNPENRPSSMKYVVKFLKKMKTD